VLRSGRGSSLWTAFELVAAGEAAACVSGGNTAAMMVVGIKVLGSLPGIQRPALMGYVPNLLNYTGMLDLGANLSVSSRQLIQFAVMGAVTVREVEGIAHPRVGLLNVGHEDSKGHDVVREAHLKLRDLPLLFRQPGAQVHGRSGADDGQSIQRCVVAEPGQSRRGPAGRAFAAPDAGAPGPGRA
jgi:glycerol-3-phosphate acyltransferase PlsX